MAANPAKIGVAVAVNRSVTITGTELEEATAVKFGSKPATSFTVDSSESITAVAPSGTGTVDVAVTTPSGTSQIVNADTYRYLRAPVISFLSPQVGPVAGGTAVTITGGNFVEVSAVRFGAQEASEFKAESSTSITAVAPPALAGSVEVTVTTPSGTSENSSARFGYESGAPEFGRCVSGPVGSGFTDTSCKNSAVAGKFAWLPGLEKTGFTTSSSSTAKFETTSKAKLTCTSATLVGRVISPSAVGDVTIRFKGCQLNANTCTTPGLGAGEIESNPLEGILGFENKARLKAALDLFPDGHSGPFLQYACAGGPTLSITGSVLLPLKADKMAATSKLKLNASKGKQKPEAFEGGTPDVLESSIGGTPDEQTGLKLSLMQVFEEEVEINAVE